MNYSAIFSTPTRTASSTLHSVSTFITHVPDFSELRPSGSDKRTSGSVCAAEEDGKQAIVQDYLTPLKLVQLSGEPDLSRVAFLELSVNTTENSLGNFGSYLPCLAELKFRESVIPCVRDLGTSLPNVQILWMTCCMLKDLDGLPALPSLKELYLAFNNVEDVSAITMLSSLEILDLERNNLSEKDQLGYLSLCSLSALTLEGNPLSIGLAEEMGSVSGYRAAVHEAIPSIKVLDDVVFSEGKVCEGAKESDDSLWSRSSVLVLSDTGMPKDWKILQSSIKQGPPLEEQGVRPRTAPSRPHGLNQVIYGNPVRALHGLRSQSVLGDCHSLTTTTHPGRRRLHAWELDPVIEDIVTQAKSEENLFVEVEEAWQLDHLSSSTNTYNRPHSPSTTLYCSLPSLFQSSPTSSPGPTPTSLLCHFHPTTSVCPTSTPLLYSSPSTSLHLPPIPLHPTPPNIPLHPTPPKTSPALPDNPHHQPKYVTDYRLRRYRKNWPPPSPHHTVPSSSQDPNTMS